MDMDTDMEMEMNMGMDMETVILIYQSNTFPPDSISISQIFPFLRIEISPISRNFS